MKLPTKVVIIVSLFALTLGAFWFVGQKVERVIMKSAAQSPFFQIEDYSKGFFDSKFRLITYGGQVRFVGEVKHGPVLVENKKLALAHVRLRLDPFQNVTSPWYKIVEDHPELKKSYIDVLINLNGKYNIYGKVPELAIDLDPKTGGGALKFNGLSFEGAGVDGNYFINGIAPGGTLTSPQMDAQFANLTFSGQGDDLLKAIPLRWTSNITLSDLQINWKPVNDDPKPITIETILVKSKGQSENNLVSTDISYHVNGITVDGKGASKIEYDLNIAGLDKMGLIELIKTVNEVSSYVDPGMNDDEYKTFMLQKLKEKALPLVYTVLGEQPSLVLSVKAEGSDLGINEGMVKVQLDRGKKEDLLARLLCGLSLDFDEKAARLIVSQVVNNYPGAQGATEKEKEPIINSFIEQLTADDGIIEVDNHRYIFGISFSGKDLMVRYGKVGHVIPIDQFLQGISSFL